MALVLFRADADPVMGTGHVMRCLAVAEALADLGHAARFAAVALTATLEARLAAAGFPSHRIDAPAGSAADAGRTLALASGLEAATVVIDGYHFDEAFRAALRAGGGRRMATFDDLGATPLHADVVVNPSLHAAALPYHRLAPGARLLLGPNCLPLRRDIRRAARSPAPPLPERRALLLSFGGSDPLGLTLPCLERLAPELAEGERLLLVVGGSDPRAGAVLARAVALGDRVEAHHDTPDMGALMARCGLAVSAGGGTIGELAAIGVPPLVVVVADNQAPAAMEAAGQGWCRMIDARGDDPSRAAGRIAAQALALWRAPPTRVAMAARLGGRVDGQGAERVARALAP
ncbi:UDP-2,4-diacetamido-2,4,6-trideoxy-beta-L-altropyranose hydrolase [Azospirillum sp.]|uniref:UDP-2,4-diacetamido-2,4, 6-trideoxy-beta-L-altropyranose hydrolase n=1 Tax=Azospirillum sp. TaxID=34012 RepID=UPI002D5FC87A|nr:UDP-2,4-diacetamido-2,4,6-trideoxy-beta-L-altropyranose hydrolase [Azospirillum sp.]HYD70509.1 UDP-2,4-diacetamido-2,4,6-trideoxy-beta-L-altropyranose hydrolase [Azospirillum sp.]